VVVLLALLSAGLGGSADFLGGSLTRRLPVALVVGASQACALLLLVPVLLVGDRPGLDPASAASAAAAGAFMLLGLCSFYSALAAGTMSIVAPLAALGVVVPLAVGLLRGETPSAVACAGMAVAVVGVVLASGPEARRPDGLRPLLLAALAAVGFGSSMLFFADAARADTLTSLLLMKALILLPFAVLAWRSRAVAVRRARTVGARQLALLVAIGVADLGANLCFGAAARRGLLSVVSVLGSLYPVATVQLAWWVHTERMSTVQRWGVLATLGGVVLISGG
jgi:drug/metabolite transporter (DMT)-like permease